MLMAVRVLLRLFFSQLHLASWVHSLMHFSLHLAKVNLCIAFFHHKNVLYMQNQWKKMSIVKYLERNWKSWWQINVRIIQMLGATLLDGRVHGGKKWSRFMTHEEREKKGRERGKQNKKKKPAINPIFLYA